jgi:CTP-dependent riboflavin kinase
MVGSPCGAGSWCASEFATRRGYRHYVIEHGDGVSRDLKGIVAAGRGLGAPRMPDPATLARIRDLAGFPPVPGTLNVVVPEPLERGLFSRYLAAAEIDPAWEAETGQAGYWPSRLTNRVIPPT